MNNKKKFNKLKYFIIFLISICIILLFVLTFSDGDPFPNWKTLLNSFQSTSEGDADFFKVIDVGQGDCLMFGSNGISAVIDTGDPINAVNMRRKVHNYGVGEIDALLITHLHDDHTGGIPMLSEIFSIEKLIIPEILGNTASANDVLTLRNKMIESNCRVYKALPGMVIHIGDFEVTVLAYYSDETNINNQSIVMMAEIDGIKILLTGDAERNVENRLIAEGFNLDCDILKVGHHGSSTSTGKRFLNATTPQYAAISCGVGNTYGHPNKDVLERLHDKDIDTFRTDLDGDITFSFDDGKVTVATEK